MTTRKKSKRFKKLVITTDNASKTLGLSVSIDKVTFKFKNTTTSDDIKSVLEKNKYSFEDTRLKNEHVIKVDDFYFTYLRNTKNYISRLITNPKDQNFCDYYKQVNLILRLFPEELVPTRVDFALDIYLKSFNWVSERLFIKRKRLLERFVLNGSDEQTKYFGKEPKTTVLYEKNGNEEEISFVRLESRVTTQAELKAENLDELIKKVLSSEIQPFKNAFLIDFRPRIISHEVSNIEKLLRQNSMIVLNKHNGYFYMRKVFNKNRNFNRDFKELFIFKSNVELQVCFQRLITKYLQEIEA